MSVSASTLRGDVRANEHAMAVITAPDVAPAAPKQVIVEKVGQASLVLAITKGDFPVALNIQSS